LPINNSAAVLHIVQCSAQYEVEKLEFHGRFSDDGTNNNNGAFMSNTIKPPPPA